MASRKRALLVAAALLFAGVLFYITAPSSAQTSAIEAVPDGSFLVVTIDVVRLRKSPFADRLGDAMSDIAPKCGWEPLDHIREIALTVPERQGGELGVAITHDLSRDQIADCSRRIVSARGGETRISEHGKYLVLEQESALLEHAKIAYREGRPLLIGKGAWLNAMMDALDGAGGSVADSREHMSLRSAVGATKPPHEQPAVIATVLLPQSLRDRLKAEMADEADDPQAVATMQAVLAVHGAALGLWPGGPDDPARVMIELRCENEAACATVKSFVERKRAKLASMPAMKLLGVSTILDGAVLEQHGAALTCTIEAGADKLARVVDAARSLAALETPPVPHAPRDAGLPQPNEVLRTRDR